MGSGESVPQPRLVHGTIDDRDVHDDNGNFRRVPASTAPNAYRSPQNFFGTSPTRCGRSPCTTLSTILTSESASFSPHSTYESEDYEQYSPIPISRDGPPEDDCWAGPVLKNIISLISPRKRNAISLNNAFESTNSHAVKSMINTSESHFQIPSMSDSPERSIRSPTRIQDFPNRNDGALPNKRLPFPVVQPLPLSGQLCQDSSEAQVRDISLPSQSNLPSRRLDPEPHFIEQQHQGDYEDLDHFLHTASRHEAKSDLDTAISSLEEFLNRSTFACDHFRATTLHKLGILQWKSGRYFCSEHVLLDCIHVYECLIDEDNPAIHEPEIYSQLVLETAHVFVSMGRVYLSEGEGDAAMRCYNECVRYLSSIPKSRYASFGTITPTRIFGQACVGAGRVLASQGKLKSSLKRYKRALKNQIGPAAEAAVANEDISSLSVHEVNVPLNDVAETLSHLGRLYEQRNDVTRALECHVKALSIYKSQLDLHSVDIGYASNNVGQLYLRLGRFVDAEEAFKTAHHVFSLRLGRNHRNTADALLSIGQLYASQGRHKKAITTFQRVLRAEPAVFGQLLAVTLHSVACSYEATLQLEKALKYYQKEASVIRTTLSPCNSSRAQLLHHMACIAMQAVDSKGEYLLLDQSLTWLEEAAEIYEGKAFNHEEIIHIQSSIEETQKRMRRKAQRHLVRGNVGRDH
mmetsp:Transcript_2545/g.5667  ORF Transcript_2545/g.5667 Transcript_2545/m.5667 type:complete len:690 (-) Transcript_2545:113-2182(-)